MAGRKTDLKKGFSPPALQPTVAKPMVGLCKRISDSDAFQGFVLFLIIVTAIAMGLETVPSMADEYSEVFLILFYVSQVVFVCEIVMRIVACAPSFGTFFNHPGNTFDFVVVSASLLPGVGSCAIVARLLRVLRVLRAFSVSDRLRVFTARLTEALDEAVYTAVVVAILCYIFSISGHYLFAELDPTRWGTLGRSALSIFYLVLLQDVPSYVSPLISVHSGSIVYFIVLYFVFASLLLSVLTAAINQSCAKEER